MLQVMPMSSRFQPQSLKPKLPVNERTTAIRASHVVPMSSTHSFQVAALNAGARPSFTPFLDFMALSGMTDLSGIGLWP